MAQKSTGVGVSDLPIRCFALLVGVSAMWMSLCRILSAPHSGCVRHCRVGTSRAKGRRANVQWQIEEESDLLDMLSRRWLPVCCWLSCWKTRFLQL